MVVTCLTGKRPPANNVGGTLRPIAQSTSGEPRSVGPEEDRAALPSSLRWTPSPYGPVGHVRRQGSESRSRL